MDDKTRCMKLNNVVMKRVVAFVGQVFVAAVCFGVFYWLFGLWVFDERLSLERVVVQSVVFAVLMNAYELWRDGRKKKKQG